MRRIGERDNNLTKNQIITIMAISSTSSRKNRSLLRETALLLALLLFQGVAIAHTLEMYPGNHVATESRSNGIPFMASQKTSGNAMVPSHLDLFRSYAATQGVSNPVGSKVEMQSSDEIAGAVITLTLCDNLPSYTWSFSDYDGSRPRTRTYNANVAGDTVHVLSRSGEDSVLTMNLTFVHTLTSSVSVVACDSYTWTVGSTEVGTYSSVPGTAPTATIVSVDECDSTITLNLTINYSSTYTQVATACDTYTWVVDSLDAAGTRTVDTYTSTTATPTAVIPNYRGCDSTITLNLTINNSSTYTLLDSACGSYTWIVDSLGAAGTDTIGTYTSTTTSQTAIIPNYRGCDSTITLNLTVNPVGQINTIADTLVCNGASMPELVFTTTNLVGTTSYAWINSDATIGVAASGSTSSIPAFTAANTGVSPVTATVTVTPTLTDNGFACSGASVSFTIAVNPSAAVDAIVDQILCNGDSTVAVNFGTDRTGGLMSYAWANDNTSIGLRASGTASGLVLPRDTVGYDNNRPYRDNLCDYAPLYWGIRLTPAQLENQTTLTDVQVYIPIDAPESYTLELWHGDATHPITRLDTTDYTPTALNAWNTIHLPTPHQVDPSQSLWILLYGPMDPQVGAVCGAAGCSYNSNPDGSWASDESHGHGVNWVNIADSGFSVTWMIRAIFTNDTNGIPAFVAVNNGSAPDTAVVTVTPTFSHNAVSCTGTPRTFRYIVNPTATVDNIADQILCNGTSTTAVSFTSNRTGGTASYEWTNNNTNIGLAASGTGDIAAFTAVNTGTRPDTAIITVTPTFTNGGVSCSGASRTFRIIVNPTATVDTVYDQILCNNATGTVNFSTTRTVGTTTFSWTNTNTNVGIAASGTGNISFTATNIGTSPDTAEITVTPTFTHGEVSCTGASRTFKIIVNPTASVDSIPDTVLCNGSALAINFTTDRTEGTTVFTWANTNPRIGINTSGAGDISQFTALNYGTAPDTAVVTVTPRFEYARVSCIGPSRTFNIVVNPTSAMNAVANQVVCAGVLSDTIIFQTDRTGDTTTYAWVNDNTGIGLAASGTGDILPFTTVNSGMVPDTATITVTPTFTHGGVSCVGSPRTFKIVVNPAATVDIIADQTLCHQSATTAVLFTTDHTQGTTTFNWTNSNPSIGLSTSGQGDIASFTVVNTDSVPDTSVIVVTPIYTLGNMSCSGASRTFNIIVNPFTIGDTAAVVCDTFEWHNNTYNRSDVYSQYMAGGNQYGCDSTVYLHLTVNYNTSAHYVDSVCNLYIWNGVQYDTTGVYTYSYTSSRGCASTDTLSLTVYYKGDTVYYDTICDSYTWALNNNAEYTTSGTYVCNYNTVHGCASIDTLHLVVNHRTDTAYNVIGCDSYTWHMHNDTVITTPGTYLHNYNTAEGCASVDTLRITMRHNSECHDTATVCDEYVWSAGNGQTYTATPVVGPTDTLINGEGCDSVLYLHLIVNHSNSGDTTVVACDNYTWYGTSLTYQQSTNVETYTDINQWGCDSVVTLHLTVNHNSNTAYDSTTCDSYTWHGTTYTTTGAYTYNYNTLEGCPSVDTLRLIVYYNTSTRFDSTICDSVIWNGRMYDNEGRFLYPYYTVNGCASTDTLVLTIHYSNAGDTVITACDSFMWYGTGRTYTVSANTAQYVDHNQWGCDSTVTLHLTINYNTNSVTVDTVCDQYLWNDSVYTVSGMYYYNYNTAEGCPSVDTLWLEVNYNSNISYRDTACDELLFTWDDGTDSTYTMTGTYYHNYTSIFSGCPSTDTLYLVIKRNSNTSYDSVACDSLVWHGDPYYASGMYTYPYWNASGCPSTDTMHLTVYYNTNNFYYDYGCDHYTWTLNNNAVYDSTGAYARHYLTAQGCPSVDTLYLTMYYNSNTRYDTTVCDSIEWYWSDGTIGDYTASGTYLNSYDSPDGCPSVDTLYLEVRYNTNTGYDTVVCDSIRWRGQPYDWTDDYLYDYTAANGCLSTDTLHLTVYFNTNMSYYDDACDTYTWTLNNRAVYDSTGVYLRNYFTLEGCPSTDTLFLTIDHNTSTTIYDTACDFYTWSTGNGQTYTHSCVRTYNYYTAEMCPSTDTLRLTVNYNTSMAIVVSACETYHWTRNDSIYTQTGTYLYDYATSDGCASTDTLYLTMNYNTNRADSATVCDSYVWNDSTYRTSGTYYYSYTTVAGCSSVDTLYLVVNHNTNTDTALTACDSYAWHDSVYTTSGVYAFAYTTDEGCPSSDTLRLTVNYNTNTGYDATACDRYTWTLNGNRRYDSTGVYLRSYVAANGCPSVDTLNLTVNYNSSVSYQDSACETLTWHGMTLNTPGRYIYNYNTPEGCPSVDTLYLLIFHGNSGDTTIMACDSITWYGTGLTYTQSTNVETYTDINQWGCDSVVTLHLTVNYNTDTFYTETACDSYQWFDSIYTTSGTYARNYLTPAGCPSTDSLYLTVNYNTNNQFSDTACDSYQWHGGTELTYTQSGTYLYNYSTDRGCPSTDTLHLTVNHNSSAIYDTTVCEVMNWHGLPYNVSGVYSYEYNTPEQCYSIDSLYLIVNYNTDTFYYDVIACDSYQWFDSIYTTSGTYFRNYLTPAGCPSTDSLYLTVYYNTDTAIVDTACDSYTWHGVARTQSGDYLYNYTTDDGCQSTDMLHLVVYHNTSTGYTANACDSYYWTRNDSTYLASGVYFYEYYVNGCPSTDTLNLTVNYNTNQIYTIEACNSYRWNGNTYNTSGVRAYTYLTDEGCTSHDTLLLTIYYDSSAIYIDTACDSYTWQRDSHTYTTSGTYAYSYTTTEGCASVDTLHLVMYNNSNTGYSAVACDSYTWDRDSITYTAGGTYLYNYQTLQGCPSVDTLSLTMYYNTGMRYVDTACDSYTWHGVTYTTSGTHRYNYYTADNCRSTDTLIVTIYRNTNTTTTVTACDSYLWSDGTEQTYTVSGAYDHAYTTAEGCPSHDTLLLTITHAGDTAYRDTACDRYAWALNGNQEYTMSGAYLRTYRTDVGCPSTDTLYLVINQNSSTLYVDTACDSYHWTLLDSVFDTSGVYLRYYNTAEGCPSTDTLLLTVNYNTNMRYDSTVCDIISWNGVEYDSTGIYLHNYSTIEGCPSTDTLALTVNHNSGMAYDTTVCDNYRWPSLNDSMFTESGVYYRYYNSPTECPSIDTLNLTVNYNSNTIYDTTVCDVMVWHDSIYITSGIYSFNYTTLSGCQSTDTLRLTVNQNTSTGVSVTACDNYIWHNVNYDSTGVYYYNYPASSGCTSVDTLYLTVNYSTHIRYDSTVCDSYTWNELTYDSTDTYIYMYTNDEGCPSADTLHLIVNHNSSTLYVDTACDSYYWEYLDSVFVASGEYLRSYTTGEGCSSTDTLRLTINNNTNTVYDTTACESYTWNDVTYDTTGVYTYSYTTNEGCASVDTLNLTIDYNVNELIVDTACDSYTWHDTVYTVGGTYVRNITTGSCSHVDTLILTVNYNSNTRYDSTVCDVISWNGSFYDTAGVYMYNYDNPANSCPSTDTLFLTVNYNTNTRYDTSACNSYQWNDSVYRQPGTFLYDYVAPNNCHSTDTLVLALVFGGMSDTTATVCDSIDWYGGSYTMDGDYDHYVVNAYGCDSVHTLHLTVKHSDSGDTTAWSCDSFTWRGNTYTNSITDTTHILTTMGCDSTLVLHLTIDTSKFVTFDTTVCDRYVWGGTTYTASAYGQQRAYTSLTGCDSIVTLNLTVNHRDSIPTVATGCDSYEWDDTTYTASTSDRHEYTNVYGCDSIMTLRLTLYYNTSHTDTVYACDSYTWHDSLFIMDGIYMSAYTNEDGCPSRDTLRLHVGATHHIDTTVVACNNFTWVGGTGRTYSSTPETDPYVILTNRQGCDSVLTLHLTINHSDFDTVRVHADTSYTWIDGNTYTSSIVTSYILTNQYGCDSVVTLNLTVEGQIVRIIQMGEYMISVNHYPYGQNRASAEYYDYRWYHDGERVTSADHSDYLISSTALSGTYYVEVPVDAGRLRWIRSNTITISTAEIDDVTLTVATVQAWPNPLRSGSTLHVSADGLLPEGTECRIYDLQGRQRIAFAFTGSQVDVPLNLEAGVYGLCVYGQDGVLKMMKIIVK